MSPESPLSDPATLLVRVEHQSDSATVRLTVSGEVDCVSSEEMRQTFTGAVHRHRPSVVEMDVGGVTFLDSSGIRTLLECRAEADQAGCGLVLMRTSRIVHRVLSISGLLAHFGLPAELPVRPSS
jgi:anti-anti-sigma factor